MPVSIIIDKVINVRLTILAENWQCDCAAKPFVGGENLSRIGALELRNTKLDSPRLNVKCLVGYASNRVW